MIPKRDSLHDNRQNLISKPIRDGELLVLIKETFAVGFFSPEVSTNPLCWNLILQSCRTTCSVGCKQNKLVLHVKDQNQPIQSTNIASKSSNNISTLAQLLDSGNLILIHNEIATSLVLWQSYDYPTDTALSYMKLGLDRTTCLNRILTSDEESLSQVPFGENAHLIGFKKKL